MGDDPKQQVATSVVTPGNHDGVHLGHRALLQVAQELAASVDAPCSVIAMSFDPHPIQLVAPERAPEMLTTPARRSELLEGAGAARVVMRRFDREFAALTPEQFIAGPLVRDLGARAVVVGDDFRFGADRSGDVHVLAELGERKGLEVRIVPKVLLDGEPISSSRVRRSLHAGDIELVSRMLGRVHDVSRSVIGGQQVGRTIGFRTANLALEGTMLPKDGVYAVAVRVLGAAAGTGLLTGVANLGNRPTIEAGRAFEVHLLDFEGDLYGQEIRVGFVARLRDEQRFPDLPSLRAQIARDVASARAALEHCDRGLLRWM